MRLPDGWERWPPDAKRRLAATLAAAAQGWTPWERQARPDQLPPPDPWDTWLILTGRGWGKTRTGAQWAHRQADRYPRGALIAPTAADARDVMVEGESGILACAPPWNRPTWEPSKRRVTWPNGHIATTYSADEPDRLRGPQHHWAWCDELAAMRNHVAMLDMLRLGLRLGHDPRLCITTTPRPLPALRTLVARPGTHVTRGTTYDNLDNLAGLFKQQVLDLYEGTRLGAQELHGHILDDVEGALWPEPLLATARAPVAPPTGWGRTVLAIDPATTATPTSDETGIIVAAEAPAGACPVCGPDTTRPHYGVLADHSARHTPHGWATLAARLAEEWGALVVAETNQGGDLVRHALAEAGLRSRYQAVHATKGKHTRAEPVVALYEQGRVHHAAGLDRLEEQQATWVPGLPGQRSPDRVDALVWAVTALTRPTATTGATAIAT